MTLWKFSAREIRSRPGRAILTVLSIVVGVAAVVSVSATTITTREAYQEMFQTLTGKADLEVVAEVGGGFDESIVPVLAKVPGVEAAAPILQRMTVLYHDHGKAKVMALGIDPEADANVRQYQLIDSQEFPDAQGAVLESSFARSLGVKVGDEVRFLTRRGLTNVKVIGMVAPLGTTSLGQGTVILKLPLAQSLFAAKGKVDAVHLVLAPNETIEDVQARIKPILTSGLIVRPPTSRTEFAEETLFGAQQGLNLATALSLVVAGFIIANAFLMNVSERRRQLAILRAIGATRKQVVWLCLREGLVMGILGTAVGMAAGIAGAWLLTRGMERIFEAKLPALKLTPLPFVLGAAFGLAVSLAATFFPSRKAGLVSPLEGMGGIASEDLEKSPWWVTATGLLGLSIAAGMLTACLLKLIPIIFAIYGVVVAVVGFVFLIPATVEPLSKLLVRFVPTLRVEGRLAHRQILRRRTRSTLTIGVLFVAIATGVGLGTTILNNTRDVDIWYKRTLLGDFFVRAMMPDMATGAAADMPDAVRPALEAIPGIEGINALRFVRARTADRSVVIIVREFTPGDKLPMDLKDADSDAIRERLFAGDVVIGSVLAQRTGLKVGDKIELSTDAGDHSFQIAGLVNEYTVGGLVIYMERQVAQRVLGVSGADVYIIQAKAGALAQVEKSLEKVTEKYGLMLQSFASLRRLVKSMTTGVVGGLWVLLALGLVVAAFGIANTLTMNVLEQTRELGMLRAIAMTRGQVRQTILAQAAIMGLVGLVPGTLVGCAAALFINLTSRVEFGRSIEFKTYPILTLAVFGAAYLIVLAAAWFPAQRAARLKLVEALKYQ